MDDELFTESPGSSQNFHTDKRNTGQQSTSSRSKHSVTEQRRRSKINERFQILRNLIPQNDQKKDKASLLLEVIEYIQFLQNKLRLYEGSYEMWNQEPSKLIPWRNNHTPGGTFANHSNTGQEIHESLPSFLPNTQNSLESDSNAETSYRPDFLHVSADPAAPLDLPLQPTMFAHGGSDSSPMQSLLHGSFSHGGDIESAETLNQGKRCKTDGAVPSNGFTSESNCGGISSAYSQGLLNTLTEALQASGVDMSHANISVQVDVSRRESNGVTALRFNPKSFDHIYASNQSIRHSGLRDNHEDSGHMYKRTRREGV